MSHNSTSLDRERFEQSRWVARDASIGRFANALLDNEFLSVDQQARSRKLSLQRTVQFAANAVGFYRDEFDRLGLRPAEFRAEHLAELPIITKSILQDDGPRFQTNRLPPGETEAGYSRTSGTTGKPLHVLQTARSLMMFTLLKQREFRWFRFDPDKKLAAIRPARELPRPSGSMSNPDGNTVRLPRWPQVGRLFRTGNFVGFNNTNPIEQIVQWLLTENPEYALIQSALLEHVALAFQGRRRPDRLRAFEGIQQQFTGEMRRRAEQTFRVPVHQNYGLNEIGIVASRCPEAGRYHVHSEHCLIEIVNEDGDRCEPNEFGRLLVTSVNNFAQPLIRYDTDDLARGESGPCPCGRTLPSIAEIRGRYRRLFSLPSGTWNYWAAVQDELETMPLEVMTNLRQYQLHQFRNGTYELRLVSDGAMSSAFLSRIRRAWDQVESSGTHQLQIRSVPEFRCEGKFENFTSDYMADADGRDCPSSMM